MTPARKTSPAVLIVIGLIVAFFGGVAVLGIVAAIAIPGFLRARMSANEAAAIAAMRTMVSAQVAWAGTHGGHYAPPSCLGAPASCGDAAALTFLTPEIASLASRSGYDFGFVLGPDEEGAQTAGAAASADATAQGAGAVSPGTPSDADVRAQLEQFSTPDSGAAPAPPATSIPDAGDTADRGGFAYWAVPSTPGSTGTRSFCTDDRGVVLEYLDATFPFAPPTDGHARCPDTGRPLQ